SVAGDRALRTWNPRARRRSRCTRHDPGEACPSPLAGGGGAKRRRDRKTLPSCLPHLLGEVARSAGGGAPYNRLVNDGWLERAGVRLHYLEWLPDSQAREPALFLLHGLSSNARVWERLADRQGARRIVALDQRSHGLSDRPPTGYAATELTADAAHAIRALSLGRPLVAGHSWGASVALELASGFPDLVSGLAI